MKTIEMQTDVLVIGGGLPGVCAAIAAAREGVRVVLLERSATLGGNCGPEIGVHPSDGHRLHPYLAATGIVGEIVEAAVRYNAKTNSKDMHYNVCMQWHMVMMEALKDAGVTVLLRHYAHTPEMDGARIKKVIAEDTATYKRVAVEAEIVIEASGDGNVAAEAGAEFRMGREAQSEYGERLAPPVADSITLGTSLVALVRKTDHEVKFIPPKDTPPLSWTVTPADFPPTLCTCGDPIACLPR